MSTAVEERGLAGAGLEQIELHLRPVLDLTEDQFFKLCQVNRELRIERNPRGELIIMPPAGGEAGSNELDIAAQLRNWAKRDGTGKAFGPSTGFLLANGAMRAPDASWVRLTRWEALSEEERKKFPPLCPDFVIELRSETDRLRTLQEKMQEYIDNGAKLGLLVDRIKRQVHVYRRGRKAKILDEPKTVPCDPPLKGFTLDLQEIW